jgi:hypothetical protein
LAVLELDADQAAPLAEDLAPLALAANTIGLQNVGIG